MFPFDCSILRAPVIAKTSWCVTEIRNNKREERECGKCCLYQKELGMEQASATTWSPLRNLALWNRSSLNTCSVKIYLQLFAVSR